jgi:hypothetical protein
MRTKTLLAAAAMLAAGLASSMAQSNVYSLNVVGYVNKTLTGGGKYTAIANPLNTSSNTFGSLLAGLPDGSEVLKFNSTIADYDIIDKFGGNWFGAQGAATTLNPGEGVLIFINGGNVTNTFVGEVLQGSLTNAFPSGYRQAGNQVPDSGTVTALGLVPPNGSELLKWNVGTQDFDIFDFFGGSWIPSAPVLDVGESFLLFSTSPFSWTRNFTVQ